MLCNFHGMQCTLRNLAKYKKNLVYQKLRKPFRITLSKYDLFFQLQVYNPDIMSNS